MSTIEKNLESNEITRIPVSDVLIRYAESFGKSALNGIDLAIATMDVLAGNRSPLYENSGEFRSVIFDIEDQSHSLDCFRKTIIDLSECFEIDYLNDVLYHPTGEYTVCAGGQESNLWLVTRIRETTIVDRERIGMDIKKVVEYNFEAD